MGIVFDWRISNMYYLDQAGFEEEIFALFFFFSRESVKQLDNLFPKLF